MELFLTLFIRNSHYLIKCASTILAKISVIGIFLPQICKVRNIHMFCVFFPFSLLDLNMWYILNFAVYWFKGPLSRSLNEVKSQSRFSVTCQRQGLIQSCLFTSRSYLSPLSQFESYGKYVGKSTPSVVIWLEMGSNLQKWKIGNQVEILGYKYSRVVEGFSTSRYYIFLFITIFLI